MDKKLDARGDACPLPVVKAKRALGEMDEGTLEVLVDNETAVQNLERFAKSRGFAASSDARGEKEFAVHIEKTAQAAATSAEPEVISCSAAAGSKVVVISSDAMGIGDDELGHKLMKGFVFALTQQDDLPSTILFYNGGVRLTTEGSPVIDDLKALVAAGVEVMSCGTCLDHYGLKEKLAVGEVTNMYAIVEKQLGASVVVRP